MYISYVRTYVCMNVCMNIRTYIRIYRYIYFDTYIHTYTHTFAHTKVRVVKTFGLVSAILVRVVKIDACSNGIIYILTTRTRIAERRSKVSTTRTFARMYVCMYVCVNIYIHMYVWYIFSHVCMVYTFGLLYGIYCLW